MFFEIKFLFNSNIRKQFIILKFMQIYPVHFCQTTTTTRTTTEAMMMTTTTTNRDPSVERAADRRRVSGSEWIGAALIMACRSFSHLQSLRYPAASSTPPSPVSRSLVIDWIIPISSMQNVYLPLRISRMLFL